MNPDTLVLLGQALLANVVADLAAAGLPAPARQVFSHGPPVRDCDQVAVWIRNIDAGAGGDTSQRAKFGPSAPVVTHIVSWGVDVALCGGTLNAEPTTAVVTGDGLRGARYAWVLERLLTTRWVKNTMFAPVGPTDMHGKGITMQNVTPEPDGGLIAVTASFAAFTRDVVA